MALSATAPLPALAALAARSLLSRSGDDTPNPLGMGIETNSNSGVAAVAALVLFRCLWGLGSELGVLAAPERRLRRKQVGDGLGVALGVAQTIVWGLAVRSAGPLRATLLAFLPAAAAGGGPQSRAALAAALAATLTFVAAFGDEVGAGMLALLGAVSAVLGKLGTKRRREDGWAVPVLAAAAAGSAVVLVLSSPLLALSFFPLVSLAFLAPYLPLHGLTSLSLPPPSALAHLALAQIFALPPRPPLVDLAALIPGILLSKRQASTPGLQGWAFPRPAPGSSRPMFSLQALQSPLLLLPPAWRPHLLTIIRTPASRRIFGFLCLNLTYMGVQMGYGIATNSLGLISDAIHMLFDCLGIGVGLWASVAATWKPDGQYTFGYSRVETLSGFANGCFLILISIFIIFEAIQRVLDPPEMETRQLLLVSSIGLAINLFGMWATGGHHHHGHSHGHGHDHGHGHSHGHAHDHGHSHAHEHTNGNGHAHHYTAIVHEKKTDHRHGVAQEVNGHAHDHGHCDHDHHHDHSNGNGNGHAAHAHEHDAHAHSHDHDHDAAHSHSHSHDHAHDHGHDNPSHDHGHDHSHSHSHDHDHGHGHGHSHAHSHNMRGVFLHVMADTLGSVGVIVSTLLIRWTGWTGFDPLASLFIATLILASVFPLVMDAARVLVLDVGPHDEPALRAALTDVAAVTGVKSYSAVRVWPREGVDLVGSLHVQLVAGADPAKVSAGVESAMRKRVPGLQELVLQLEGEDRFCACMTS